MNILKKIPDRSAILSVYAISVMLVYGWTSYWFIWNFPSWIYYLTVTEIISIAAYAAITNLLESLVLLCLPLVMALILPAKWFSDKFVAAGALLVAFIGALLMYYAPYFQAEDSFSYTPFYFAPVLFVVSLGLAIMLARIRLASIAIGAFTERAQVFLLFSIPLSIISIFVVVIQNLTR
jgi:hypothetical protein